VKIVDAVTMPTGSLESAKLLDYEVPREFVAYFLIKDESPLSNNGLNWSVELRIQIGDLGTPLVTSLSQRGLTQQNEIVIDGLGNYQVIQPHAGVSRKQIAIVEKNLRLLIDYSLSIALQTHSLVAGGFTLLSKTRKISEKDLKRFRKEMIDRSAKTKLTPEFLSYISKIYISEVKRAEKAKDRCRTTEVIQEATGFQSSKGTVEKWVSRAREEGLLPPVSYKKVSAKKAGSKPKTKAKKGE
jgi:hypothetical protein